MHCCYHSVVNKDYHRSGVEERRKYFDWIVVEFVPGAGARVFALDVVTGHWSSAVFLGFVPLDFNEVLSTVHHNWFTRRVSRI